jgi:hypothetical protein
MKLSLISKIWMKVVFEYKAKIMPIKEGMQWVDFVDMLTQEFGIRAWNVCLILKNKSLEYVYIKSNKSI